MLTCLLAFLTWTFITLYRRPATAERAADKSAASHTPADRISRVFLALMFLTVGMIWTRSIFRLIEQQQGMYRPSALYKCMADGHRLVWQGVE